MAIRLQVYQNTLEITCGEPVIEGGIRANEVVFTFSPGDETWDGMARVAVFETRVDKRAVLLEDGRSCTIPWEVLADGSAGSYLRIGLYGTEEDPNGVIVRSTIWADNPYRVLPGPDADPGKDPTPDQYQQMLGLTSKVVSRLDELDNVETNVKASEQKAAASASAASASASAAKNSASAAQTSATAATSAKTEAENAVVAAEKAEDAAAISAHNAQVWAEGGTLQDADGGNDPSGPIDGAKQFAEKAEAAKELTVQAATSAAGAQANASQAAQEATTRANQAQQSASAADSSRAAAETAAGNAKTSETNAKASETAAEESATAAESAKDAAVTAKNGAVDARTAIENMLVEAVTLASGQNATVSKSLVDQVVKLTFGLPAGPAGKDGAPGQDGKDGAPGQDGKDGAPGQDGEPGPQGVGITSIERTAGNGAPGTTDTYTITLSNGTTAAFTVYNGANGEGSGDFMANGSVAMTGALQMGNHRVTGVGAPQGDNDAVRRMDLTAGNVKFSDGETFQQKYDAGDLTGPPGADGAPGQDGAPGVAGQDGADGEDGGYYQPAVDSAGNLTWTASKSGMPGVAGANIRGPAGADGAPGQDGADGAPGAAGKSAYQAAVEKGYTGTEEEFNTALAGMKDGPFLPATGGDVTAINITGSLTTDGDITVNLNGCRVQGVNGPTSDTDAANKQYVDGLVGNINSALDAINGEVV